jgi:hypothetical protein
MSAPVASETRSPLRASSEISACSAAGPSPGATRRAHVRAAHREQRQGPCPAPPGELTQVERVGLAGQAAVSGQVAGEGEPLGVGEYWLDGYEGG